jgi:hypothetical protein
VLGEQSPECGDISSMSRLMGHEVLPREDTTAMESPGDGTGIHACLRNRILGVRLPPGAPKMMARHRVASDPWL